MRAIAFLFSVLFFASFSRSDAFVRVRQNQFLVSDKPYYFIGANFWSAMNLGVEGPTGDRDRLVRELDRLHSLGLNNLRIMAATEGPDTEPWRIVPSLQKKPGVFEENLLRGLDFLLDEMRKRGMYAVVCLNNFWPWSGGMAQYLNWNGGAPIPYPPPQQGGSWLLYQNYTQHFYSNENAMKQYETLVRTLVTRRNAYSGLLYVDDSAIMSWQLANEPRGIRNGSKFNQWISRSARLIKSLDSNHLVTTGSEGETSSPLFNGMDFIKNHSDSNIDYATVHIWVQNAGWYDPANAETSFPQAVSKMQAHLADHLQKANRLGKPLVLEEFGMARDWGNYDPASETKNRDRYFALIFEEVKKATQTKGVLAGANFWAWAGESRPTKPYGSHWKPGMSLIGDPPHEPQGWYSVYDSDKSTLQLASKYAKGVRRIHK